jgi:hypothetical protein
MLRWFPKSRLLLHASHEPSLSQLIKWVHQLKDYKVFYPNYPLYHLLVFEAIILAILMSWFLWYYSYQKDKTAKSGNIFRNRCFSCILRNKVPFFHHPCFSLSCNLPCVSCLDGKWPVMPKCQNSSSNFRNFRPLSEIYRVIKSIQD